MTYIILLKEHPLERSNSWNRNFRHNPGTTLPKTDPGNATRVAKAVPDYVARTYGCHHGPE